MTAQSGTKKERRMAAAAPPFFSSSPPDKKSRHFERSEASENGETLDEVKSFVPMLRDNLNGEALNEVKCTRQMR